VVYVGEDIHGVKWQNYNINVDFDRMGLIPGGLLQMRAVSRYGNSVNGISGSLIPVNADATHPTTSALDDDVGLWLPVINYTQFLSETFTRWLWPHVRVWLGW
jgi:hypothetical protein